MKHVRTFESLNTPQVGDYIIISYVNLFIGDHTLNNLAEFLNNNIGVVC